MKSSVGLLLKGLAMGAANVVPGVSGGTIALIAGIYERLIGAIRRFDTTALSHLSAGRLRAFWEHVDGHFLLPLLLGVGIGIVALARLIKWLLDLHPIETMAFFFGLIMLSIWYVGRTVGRWHAGSVLALILGTALAAGIALRTPMAEDASAPWVFVCGVIAICSMILPGKSGSFVLIVLGNYALVLGAVARFELAVLLPMALGCVFGLVAFSHLLGWLFKRFPDVTIALMTGFVVGSLAVIWPWKHTVTTLIERDGAPAREMVTGYQWYLPPIADPMTWAGIALIALGAATIWLVERLGQDSDDTGDSGTAGAPGSGARE